MFSQKVQATSCAGAKHVSVFSRRDSREYSRGPPQVQSSRGAVQRQHHNRFCAYTLCSVVLFLDSEPTRRERRGLVYVQRGSWVCRADVTDHDSLASLEPERPQAKNLKCYVKTVDVTSRLTYSISAGNKNRHTRAISRRQDVLRSPFSLILAVPCFQRFTLYITLHGGSFSDSAYEMPFKTASKGAPVGRIPSLPLSTPSLLFQHSFHFLSLGYKKQQTLH